MRTIRIALAGALALSAAAVVSVPAAQAVTTSNVLTLDSTSTNSDLAGDHYFDDTHGLTSSLAAPNAEIEFVGQYAGPGDSQRVVELWMQATSPATLTPGLHTVDPSAAGDVWMSLRVNFSTSCYLQGGTLNITDATTDGTGNIVSFAADFSGLSCNDPSIDGTMSGSIRWNSTQDVTAVATSPYTWNWGDQLFKVDAQPRTMTFTNNGTTTVTPAAASITGATSVFTIKSNTCTAALAPGASCAITVRAHPLHATAPDTGVLHVPMSGLSDRLVPLTVDGDNFAGDFALAGPQRVQLHWDLLPAPIGAVVDHYRIERGTSSTNLAFWRNVPNCCPTDGSVTAGKVYYYAVQPVFTGGGGAGVRTPIVAAKPWPKYSSGMYHRITPSRLLNNHTIAAGHPYSLKLLGQHHVPSKGVSAVVLHVTVSKPTRDTGVTVFPRGTTQPSIADVNLAAGSTDGNLVIAKVGNVGSVLIANAHGSAGVTVDVSGYFSGSGLATTYGQGGALQEYVKGGVILDTKGWKWGPTPHDYYDDAPVNFDALDTPHVTSLLVQVTAYGSSGGGTITGFATNGSIPGTSVLTYRAGVATTNTAIISAGKWSDPSTFQQYPSVSFLNRGAKPVQLKVSILGFFDDNTYLSGQRYHPTAPKRLFANTMYAGSTRTVAPGAYGHPTTTALNLKVRATAPTVTTSLSMWPRCCSVTSVPQPQVRAPAHHTAVDSTLAATGNSNQFALHNAAGRTDVAVWAFGTADAWPLPNWQWYVGEIPAQTAVPASVVEHRFDYAARAAGGAPVVVHDLSRVGPGRVAQYARYRDQFAAQRR